MVRRNLIACVLASSLYTLPYQSIGIANAQGRHKENGISVSRPKLFDERTLYARLQTLQNALLSMNTFYGQSQIAAAIGTFQGTSAYGAQQQFNATIQLPTNTFNSSQTLNNSSSTSNGNSSSTTPTNGGTPVQNTTTTSGTSNSSGITNASTSTVSQATPTIPALQTLPTATGIAPISSASLSPGNLLAQQTAVNFQIVNLSMLLDRSISDRVSFADDNAPRSRVQAVVGFNISVMPKYANAVADVEIIITSNSTINAALSNAFNEFSGPIISLVTLLPQENTYNIASYTNTTHGYNIGTVFQFFGISAAGNHSNTNLYVAQDVDTIAFQRIPDAPSNLRFGWQFRPVLNRSTVDAGTRQVFAVISVPGVDPGKPFDGQVEAVTIWRRYDRKHRIVGAPIDDADHTRLGDLKIYATSQTELALAPKVDNVQVTDIGNGNVQVEVTGENFYPGTAISGVVPNAFSLESEHRLRFVVAALNLVSCVPSIVGNYGDTVSVYPIDNSQQDWALQVIDNQSSVTQYDQQTSRVKLAVTYGALNKKGHGVQSDLSYLAWKSTPNTLQVGHSTINPITGSLTYPTVPVVIIVGNQIYGLADHPFIVDKRSTDSNSDIVRIFEFDVPTSLLRTARQIVVQPLGYDLKHAGQFFPEPKSDFVVSAALVVPEDPQSVDVILLGTNLQGDHYVNVIANGVVLNDAQLSRLSTRDSTNYLLKFRMSRDEARGLSSVIVYRPGEAAQIVPVQAPTPGAVAFNAPPLNLGDDVFIPITGNNLNRVTGVQFDSSPLTWSYDPVKMALSIHVTKDVTDKVAKRTLVVTLDDGTIVPLTLNVTDPTPTTGAKSQATAPSTTVTVATDSVIARRDVDLRVIGGNLDQIIKAKLVHGSTFSSGPIMRSTDESPTITWLFDPNKQEGMLKLKAYTVDKPGVLTVLFILKDKSAVVHGVMVLPAKQK